MSKLLNTPLTLPCGAKLKNRIAKSAMSENMGDKHHRPTDKHSRLYKVWSDGGAGLLVTGNIMVDRSALGEPNNVVIESGIDKPEEFQGWAQAVAKDTHLWGQLNHPGKQSPKFLSKEPVAPSVVPYESSLNRMFNCPRELSEEGILDVIDRFGNAAKILKQAGFTGVQIHGAHGYLVSQFLSSHHNRRQDRWGGSIENRMRFPLAVYDDIRSKVGVDFPIGIKLNSTDFQKGGFSEDECLIVAKAFDERGIDLLEISGGTYEAPVMMKGKQKESTRKREAYFLDFAETIRKHIGAPIMLTGGFRSARAMDDAIKSNACSVVGLARSMALDPNLPKHVLSDSLYKSQTRTLSTGFKALDKLVPLEITWYTQQLVRLASKGKSYPEASEILSVAQSLFTYGKQGLSRVRARR